MTWPLLPILVCAKRTGWPPIWLPVIVLWPLLYLIALVALPLCFLFPPPQAAPWAPLTQSYRLLCSLHRACLELTISPGVSWAFSVY